jgi:hypothetical protein
VKPNKNRISRVNLIGYRPNLMNQSLLIQISPPSLLWTRKKKKKKKKNPNEHDRRAHYKIWLQNVKLHSNLSLDLRLPLKTLSFHRVWACEVKNFSDFLLLRLFCFGDLISRPLSLSLFWKMGEEK